MILRTRILALAALLAVLFLSLVGYTLAFFSSASGELNRIVERNLAVERTTETLNSTILQIRSDIWDTMVFDLAHRKAQVDRLDNQARAFYQGLRDLANQDPAFAQTAQDLRFLFQGYYQFGSTILELNSLDEFVGESQLVQKFRENQAGLLGRLSQTLTDSKQQFFGAMAQLNADFSSTTVTAFSLAGIVTLVSFFVAILMARRLARPLERLTKTARQVSNGNYSIRPDVTSSGEIRDLTETFTVMLDQIQDYSTRMEDLVRARTDALVRTNAVMVKELKLAQKIQGALIPNQFSSDRALAVAGAYLPMEELGGDFYDVFEGSSGVWTIVMADVSGHGVPAALVTAMVKVSLGLHGAQATDPGQVLDEVNRELCAALGDLHRYVTMVYCHLDLNARTLAYCNAGHNEIVLVRASGKTETLGPNSGVVGRRPDELFLTRTLPFQPGDGILLFTDGLVEARSPDLTPFTLDRLLTLVEAHRETGPQTLVDRITSEVEQFSRGQNRQDDIAYLAVQWTSSKTAPHSPSPHFSLPEPTSPWSRAEDLYRTKDFDLLIAWTDQKIAAEPPPRVVSRLLHWQGLALQRQGRSVEALGTWARALEADPNHHRARRSHELLSRHLKEVAHDA